MTSPNGDDSDLIAKVAELERIYAETSPAAMRERRERGEPATDDELNEAGAALNRLHVEIASAPVDTLQGIAAKLRAMQLDLHEGTGGDYRETVLATIMAALERMEVSAAPDPLVALEAERREKEAAFIEANKVYYDAEGELFKQPEEARSSAYKARVKTLQQASQEASKRADAVDESIAGTPAISSAGIAVKLRRAADWIDKIGSQTCADDLVQSALADIGRLAGGAVSPDPVPELVRKYRDAMRGYGSGTDEENAVYDTEVLTPAEEALAKAVPTTRQGVIAVLETVARRHRRPRDPDIAIDKQVILTALVKNALKAIKAGAGC